MMSMLDLLAQGSSGPGEVIGMRDVRVRQWLVCDRVRELHTEATDDRIRLLADGQEIATARVIRGPYQVPPTSQEPIEGALRPDPYASGALFHGPAFQVLESSVVTAEGASSVLRADSGVPLGLLNPGLLDGATHAIPHDALRTWHPEVADDVVAYPAWIPEIDFFGPPPTEGTVRCEVRPDGLVGGADYPAHRVQLVFDGRVWASFRLVEACFPKGPLGAAPRAERRAFLRDGRYVEGLRLSKHDEAETRLSREQVRATDWLPGTVEALYGSTDAGLIAARERMSAAHGIHPGRLPAALPLTRFELETTWDDDVAVVSGAPEGTLDLTPVRGFWSDWFGRGRWPVEDLYYGLARRFVRRVVVEDPAALDAIAGRSAMYLGNHQTGVESLVFSIIASGLTRVPTVTLAKAEHRTTWLGRLIELCFRYPNVEDPRIIAFFDRDDRASLTGIIADLAAEMRSAPRSVMVHVEGTRSKTCRAPVRKMSGAFVDMALEVGAPIVPVRFVGGLPVEPSDGRLEFPLGFGQQDIYIGRPQHPAELAPLHYGERKARIIAAINGLGPANAEEGPLPPSSAFQAKVEAWRGRTGVSTEDATLGCILAECPSPTDGVRRLLAEGGLAAVEAEDGPEAAWLAELGRRLTKP